eukprot:g6817.t1
MSGSSNASASASGSFSAPPSATAEVQRFSYTPPPLSQRKTRDYESADFSGFSSTVRESDGLNDDRYVRDEMYNRGSGAEPPGVLTGFYNSLPPRAKGCLNAISMGARMGAAVGGCFGFLTGAYASVAHRNVLLLPVGVLGGAASFGFFLGCGMIVRCEEPGAVGDSQRVRLHIWISSASLGFVF